MQLQGRGGETAGWCDRAGTSEECRRLARVAALARPPPGPPPGRDAVTGMSRGVKRFLGERRARARVGVFAAQAVSHRFASPAIYTSAE